MNSWSNSKTYKESWEIIKDPDVIHPVSGAQACAKMARNKNTGDFAFLKILNNQQDDERRARFLREATAYETCSHPSIANLIDSNAHFFKDNNFKLYIATKYINGETLGKRIESYGCQNIQTAVSTTERLLEILLYLHKSDLVHRDIKPDNIILRNSDFIDPVLVDFGLCYKDDNLEVFQTDVGEELGNRFLRLPELSIESTSKRDPRSDLAFAGGIFFYMLTSVMPSILLDAKGRMPHQRDKIIEKLKEIGGSYFMNLLEFFDYSFSYTLSGRFESASVMIEALNNISKPKEIYNGDININLKRNDKLNRLKAIYLQCMEVINYVNRKVEKKVSPTYKTCHQGFSDFIEGHTEGVGFVHFASHKYSFIPLFKIYPCGNEIIVKMDAEIIYRTEINDPKFDNDSFKDKIRDAYIFGIMELEEKLATSE